VSGETQTVRADELVVGDVIVTRLLRAEVALVGVDDAGHVTVMARIGSDETKLRYTASTAVTIAARGES